MNNSSTKTISESLWLYVGVGWLIGTYFFFQTPHNLALLIFDGNQGAAYWYRGFSDTIFKPQNIYVAESLLWPLIAKLLNASSSLVGYQTLNAFATLVMMPVICVAFKKRVTSTFGVFIAIALWSATYVYLQFYDLGFPDPVTIILLSLVVAQTRKEGVFIFSFLAALSHFSCASLAILGFLLLSVATKDKVNRDFFNEAYAVLGLVLGKLFLMVWGYVFHYRLNSRIDIVFEKGVGFFIDRYLQDPLVFWYTPGKLFLALNLIIFTYFAINRKLKICAAQLVVLGLAYFSLFITVDGLRVFAVVIAPGYLYLIVLFLNDILHENNRQQRL
jgi:hypothetical protein